MSFYNLVCGVTHATFFVLPVLGKHPGEYPRFRDCFIGDPEHSGTEGKIIVYTRTGGGNREGYAEENAVLTEMDGYLFDYDDDFDSTFANWVFNVPERWRPDVDAFLAGDLKKISPEYVDLLIAVYPKLEEKIRKTFAEPTPTPPEADGEE